MRQHPIACLLLVLGAVLIAHAARAETNLVRLSYGYSTGYLPLMIVRDQHLLEKHAAALGLGACLRPSGMCMSDCARHASATR
jgi:hypothetical protein